MFVDMANLATKPSSQDDSLVARLAISTHRKVYQAFKFSDFSRGSNHELISIYQVRTFDRVVTEILVVMVFFFSSNLFTNMSMPCAVKRG